MSNRPGFIVELDGAVVWESRPDDGAGDALHALHALAGERGRPVKDFAPYVLLPELNHPTVWDDIRSEYMDVSVLELERMFAYERSVD